MNIYESICAVSQDIRAIPKGDRNNAPGASYNFRGIDRTINAVSPILAKHHIFIVPEVLDTARTQGTTSKGTNMYYTVSRVKYTVYAEDGTSISAVMVGEGADTSDKSTNKSLSASYKYLLFQLFAIPTEDDSPYVDGDADTPDMGNLAQSVNSTQVPEPVKEGATLGDISAAMKAKYNKPLTELAGEYRAVLAHFGCTETKSLDPSRYAEVVGYINSL